METSGVLTHAVGSGPGVDAHASFREGRHELMHKLFPGGLRIQQDMIAALEVDEMGDPYQRWRRPSVWRLPSDIRVHRMPEERCCGKVGHKGRPLEAERTNSLS